MINIAVCEDNLEEQKSLLKLIRDYIYDKGYSANIHTFFDGDALLEQYKTIPFSLIFLDIFLGQMSGIEVARHIRQNDTDPIIILVTSSRDFAPESYDINAAYYIVKPVTKEDFEKAMHRCSNLLEASNKYIEIIVNREPTHVLLKKILFVEVLGNKTLLHTSNEIMNVYMPLDRVMDMLDSTFLRCHKSYAINMSHVERIDRRDFVMKNGMRVPIRTNGRADVVQQYNRFFADSMRACL